MSTTINGNTVIPGTNIDKIDGASTEVPEYKVPSSKRELNNLLLEYSNLVKNTKEAKENHDLQSIDNTELKSRSFFDPNYLKKLNIEKVLFKVCNDYENYLVEAEEFFNDLDKTTSKGENGESLDFDLLQQQIVGLQLLSKDLDLPESLQENLEGSPLEDDSSYSGDQVFSEIFENTDDYTDYLDKIKKLGINVPSLSGSGGSSKSNLGNYFAEQTISSKISNRIKELENLPLNLGTFEYDKLHQDNYDNLKINSLIELKGLKTLAKQKQLKKFIINYQANEAHIKVPSLIKNSLINQATRSYYIRSKIEQNDPETLAIKLEEKKQLKLKREQHLLHVKKIRKIVDYSHDLINQRANKNHRRQQICKGINSFHNFIEKDESKKLEKTAKQRLQALKANDEDAYIKLLDETKDHRITHLLKQTNSFLDSLAQAVKVQQAEDGAELPADAGDQGDSVDELREKIDYYQVAHRIQEDIVEQPKILTGGKLKEYQMKGLQWMVSLYNNKLNGILADEMGLGKTIQSISLVTYLIEKKHEDKFLVVVPLSTITNWTMEFEKWAPSVKTVVYKGSQQQRRMLQPEVRLGNFQVLLTTYEYIIRERPVLSRFEYSHMIIDEGHRMKNSESKLSVTLRSYYKTKNRIILTGTPLQNNLPELWALLNFVLPKIFNSVKSFDEWFNTPFANTGSQEKIELTEEESLLVIRRLHKVLRPFLLRRLKKDVEKDLPDKVEKVLKCNLSGLQFSLYQQMLKHNALFVGSDVGNTKNGIKGLNNKIMQLRKICNHPFVFEEVEAVLNSTKLTNDLIWRTSGKFELLDRVLPKFKSTGHRVLMFFQMTQVMDIMEDFLRWRDLKYLRLDGATKAEDRQEMLRLFNDPNSEYFCFLLSTRAGGLGLNLQTADTVIIFDTDWNPHQDLQAQDRAHRIGQKNEVRILRLISNDSVEEVILERAHQKLDIDGKVIQAGKFDNKSTAEEQEEFLKKLLEAENSKDDSEEKSILDDDEINEILARNETEKEIFGQMDSDRMVNDKLNSNYNTRLIAEGELPKIFTEDVTHHFEKDVKEVTKMRVKKRVKYDDGLTEEQWLMAMDDDNDTVEDAIKRKEARLAKRRKVRAIKEGKTEAEIAAEEEAFGITELDGDGDDDEEEEDEERPKKRSRTASSKAANGFSQLNDDDDEEEASETGIEEEEEEEEEDPNANNPIIKEGKSILDKLSQVTDESDGHNVTDMFITLPSRKLYPDYYKLIKTPVSINQVTKKLNNNKYYNIDELKQDLLTMCSNAKTYNEESSFIYHDAAIIETFLNQLN